MPHTSHRKKSQRNKRAQVTDDDGWTRVTTTSTSQRRPRPLPAQQALEDRYALDECEFDRPQTPTDKTIDQIEEQYRNLEKRWLESVPYKELERCFEEDIDLSVLESIDKCIVFGTSTFCGLRNGWIERFHVSMYQLAAFLSVINLIHNITGVRPPVFAQEPIYNHLDIELLTRLDITTIDTPTGFKEITVKSFVFSPNAELEVTLRTLAGNPAIAMVTSKLDIFFRNDKGEACTNAIHVYIGGDDTEKGGNEEGPNEGEDKDGISGFDTSKFRPLHKLSDQERRDFSRAKPVQDEIEQGLEICEGFMKDKNVRKLPSLDAKDEPFYDVHLFFRQPQDVDDATNDDDKIST